MATDWIDIYGYEGFYQLDRTGVVKSLSGVLIRSNGRQLKIKEQLLTQHLNRGYPAVTLTKNRVQKVYKLHRLLLSNFVGMCPIGMEACHLDDNKLNYSLENLYWGARADNQKDRIKNGRCSNKPVVCLSDNRTFESIREASRVTGVDRKTLSLCLRGFYRTAGGYRWKFITVAT